MWEGDFMTKAVIAIVAVTCAVGGGYLGSLFAAWVSVNPSGASLWLFVGLGAVAGALLGSLLGYVVAGLLEA
jgi:hypothetical protein